MVARGKLTRWHFAVAANVLVLSLLFAIGCTQKSVGTVSSEPPVAPPSTSTPTASPTSQMETVSSTLSEPAPKSVASVTPWPVATSVPTPNDQSANGPATTTASTPDAVGSPELGERRQRVIALDPGHGGPETGAAAYGLAEKDVNLKIALKLAEILRADDYRVVLTREDDAATSPDYKGGSYSGGLVHDLQARVDVANAAQADLFISIHNNGSSDPSESGTEVWYDPQRSFGDRNLALAKIVERSLVDHVRALGYSSIERGVKDDTNFRIFRGRAFNIFVLGSGDGARPHTPTQMPGVLGESLFISNSGDAAMLRQEGTLDAIAAGYKDAIATYFERFPDKLVGP